MSELFAILSMIAIAFITLAPTIMFLLLIVLKLDNSESEIDKERKDFYNKFWNDKINRGRQ